MAEVAHPPTAHHALVFIGFMAAGKSRAAEAVAERLGAKRRGHSLRRARLARSHEAHEHERTAGAGFRAAVGVAGQRLHPMRSS